MEDSPRKPKNRQKLCHNCEGEIDLDVIVCPFCAADLRVEKPEQGRISFNTVPRFVQDQQTSQSLYPSPFPVKAPPAEPEAAAAAPPQQAQQEPISATEEETRNFFGPTILFTLGVQLVLIGLLMLLFSHKGVVVLKWNAGWWPLYCAAGCPFLYFGYRALSKL